jgi:hypothetical protein
MMFCQNFSMVNQYNEIGNIEKLVKVIVERELNTL